MPQIIVLPNEEFCPEGVVIEVETGTTVCRALLANDVEIEHACEMSNACTTCHVHIREGFDSIEESDEIEDDLLDKAWGLDPDSRLSVKQLLLRRILLLRYQNTPSTKFPKTINFKTFTTQL